MTPNDMYFKKTKELRYWVQRVLPLVYDDSLSFYELLSKVVDKINILVENNNKLPGYIEKTIKEQIQDIENLEEIIKEVIKELLEMEYYTKTEIDRLLLDLKNTINEEFEEYYTKTETDEKYVTSGLSYLERNGEKVNRMLHTVEPYRRHIDAINGNDNNDGLTPETAFRTLDRFFEECNLNRVDIRAYLHNPTNGTLIYTFTHYVFTGICFHLGMYESDTNVIVSPDPSTSISRIIGYCCRFNISGFKLECGFATDNSFVTMNRMEITGHTMILGGHLTLNNCTFNTLELRYSIGNTANITFNNTDNSSDAYAFDIHQGSYVTNEADLIVNSINGEGKLIRVDESTFIDRSALTNNTSFDKLNIYVMQSLWRSSLARYKRYNVLACIESSIDVPSELAADTNGSITFNDMFVNGSVKANGRSMLFTVYSPRSLVNARTLTATDVKAYIKVMKNVPTTYTIAGEKVTIPTTSYSYVGTTTGVVDWIAEGVTIATVKKDEHHFNMELYIPDDSEIVKGSVPVIYFDALTIQIS